MISDKPNAIKVLVATAHWKKEVNTIANNKKTWNCPKCGVKLRKTHPFGIKSKPRGKQ